MCKDISFTRLRFIVILIFCIQFMMKHIYLQQCTLKVQERLRCSTCPHKPTSSICSSRLSSFCIVMLSVEKRQLRDFYLSFARGCTTFGSSDRAIRYAAVAKQYSFPIWWGTFSPIFYFSGNAQCLFTHAGISNKRAGGLENVGVWRDIAAGIYKVKREVWAQQNLHFWYFLFYASHACCVQHNLQAAEDIYLTLGDEMGKYTYATLDEVQDRTKSFPF